MPCPRRQDTLRSVTAVTVDTGRWTYLDNRRQPARVEGKYDFLVFAEGNYVGDASVKTQRLVVLAGTLSIKSEKRP